MAVDVHRARAAQAHAAAEFGAGEPQVFADHPEQRGIRWRVSKVALTVDRQIRHGWVSPSLYGRTY